MTEPMNAPAGGRPLTSVLPPLFAPGLDEMAHHRMVNHLTMLSALVLADTPGVTDPAACAILNATHLRMSAMTHVYRRLARAPTSTKVDLSACLRDLATDLESGCAHSISNHRVLVESAAVMATPERAVAIVLMVCELIANSCRYALAAGGGGDVKIRLKTTLFNGCRLEVEERSSGRSPDRRARRIGQQRIEVMALHLGGLYCWQDTANGTRFVLYVEQPT